MQCGYFERHECRSCTFMGQAYGEQLAGKDRAARAGLAEAAGDSAWREPFASRESQFRNKAKLVVGGTPGAVTLGILDGDRRGVDLRRCGLHEPAVAQAIPVLADWIDDLRLLPYDVAKRRGELKHVLVTGSPAEELMVRVVLRGDSQAQRVRDGLEDLQAALPHLRVATVNYLPEHVALLEGDDEEVLTPARTLAMDLGRLTLHLGPRSFFQTNTAVAVGLYEQARDWVAEQAPASLLDLYCGVGGFGLFAATLPDAPTVLGVEVSADAVASARHTAESLRDSGTATNRVEFRCGDAGSELPDAECVVVNPPRRGLGDELCAAIESSNAATLIYSSCNPTTLARDLAALPTFAVIDARLFDMFPQTPHAEVVVRATR